MKYFNFSTGSDSAGDLWLLLVANSKHRVHSNFSGLKLLTKVAQRLAAVELSPNVSHLIFTAILVALENVWAKIGPIAIGVVMKRLISKYLIFSSIADNAYLTPLQVSLDVK